MNILSFYEIGKDSWDALCASSLDGWFRHTSSFIEFALTLGEKSENLSFAVANASGTVIALFPLVMQTVDGAKEFAMGGTPNPFPAFIGDSEYEERTEALTCGMGEIDRRAKEYGVLRTKIFVDPLTGPITSGQMLDNPFQHFGYSDTSIETTVIELYKSKEDIFKNIAKGHRSDIHFAEKQEYRIEIVDKNSITSELCEVYKKIYFAAAGREVGNSERWRLTFQQVKDDYGILVLARPKDSDDYIAGNVVSTYQKRAYYALSATLPSAKLRGIGALMQWETIKYLKSNNFTHYELGWLLPQGSSEKDMAISHFKKLFGGTILPLYRGERQY